MSKRASAHWTSWSSTGIYEQLARELGCEPRDDSPEGLRRTTSNMLKLRGDERRRLVRQYAWAIPCEDALAAIAAHAPIVEMGAGVGYWARLLRERGLDTIAYDRCPRDSEPGAWRHTQEVRVLDTPASTWTEVLLGEPPVLRHHADRTLLLCWPPYKSSMAFDCLQHWQGRTRRRQCSRKRLRSTNDWPPTSHRCTKSTCLSGPGSMTS